MPGSAPGPSERMMALRRMPDGPDSAEALLAATEDPSPDIARAALRRLARAGTVAAAEYLPERMLEVEPALTADFARAVRALGDERAAGLAADALIAGKPHRRIAAATALEVLAGKAEIPALLAATKDPLAAVRSRSVRTLGQIGAAVDAPACEALLGDENATVRAAAVEAVASLSGRSRQVLGSMVDDPAPQVRQSLARHLGRLEKAAEERLLDDRHPAVRTTAIATAAPTQTAVLERRLDSDPVPEVRIAAARRLAEIGSGNGIAALIAALADPGVMVRAAAERALRESTDRDMIVDHLLDSLTDADAALRKSIVYTLGHLHATDSAPVLAALSKDPDREVRLAVVHCGLQLFGATWPPLLALTADPDEAVSYAAMVAAEK